MSVSGPLSHLDLSVGDPDRSIPFYAALLEGIGFIRFPSQEPGWTGDEPQRAAWFIRYSDGSFFGVDLRPSEEEKRDQRYDRYAPGPHHLAFHAENRKVVDRVQRPAAEQARITEPGHDREAQVLRRYPASHADHDSPEQGCHG